MSSARTYHVDCTDGRDSANGRLASTAWRTLTRANRAHLRPGDSLLLRRGCRWVGPLLVTWSGTKDAPVTIGSYGEGSRPVIEDAFQDILVTGSWFVIQDVHVRADAPTHDAKCRNQPSGVRFGIFVDKGSRHGVIRDILATELNTGVRIALGASGHSIIDSEFRDNDMKSDDPESDSGAVAIDLQGDDNVVAGNHISGSVACSRFFGGRDGSAISVYGGQHNDIHHNISSQNHDFVELGNPRTSDTLIAYNVDHSTLPDTNFAVVHGLGSKYGPVTRTRIVHNTSVLTGRRAVPIACSHAITGDDLEIRGNIMWGDADVVTCEEGFVEGDNIYWANDGHPSVTFELAATSRKVDPRLVDPDAGNLRPRADSPAIDAIRPMDLGAIGAFDADGAAVPQGFAPDIGAYEFTNAPVPTPTPDPFANGSPGSGPSGALPTGRPAGSGPVTATPLPTEPPEATPQPTPTPRVTPTPEPPPTAGITTVPPPTGGSGALDQLLVLGAAIAGGGLLVAVFLARRSPR